MELQVWKPKVRLNFSRIEGERRFKEGFARVRNVARRSLAGWRCFRRSDARTQCKLGEPGMETLGSTAKRLTALVFPVDLRRSLSGQHQRMFEQTTGLGRKRANKCNIETSCRGDHGRIGRRVRWRRRWRWHTRYHLGWYRCSRLPHRQCDGYGPLRRRDATDRNHYRLQWCLERGCSRPNTAVCGSLERRHCQRCCQLGAVPLRGYGAWCCKHHADDRLAGSESRSIGHALRLV